MEKGKKLSEIRVLAVMSGLSAGGAETMYMNLYRKLDKTKYRIDFLIFGSDRDFYADEVRKNGSKIFIMSSVRASGIRGFCRSVEQVIQENGPYAVVHSHIDYLSGFIMRAAKRCGVGIRIAHSHSTSADTHRGTIPKIVLYYFRSLINQNATQRVACSREAAEYMFGKRGASAAEVINNAVDLNRFCDSGQYKCPTELSDWSKKVVLHIGRFVDAKNQEKLIHIFQQYRETHDDALLILVGEGELRSRIFDLVAACGLSEDVRFLGARSDIPELLSATDVFVLPSKFEGLPVTLIEAQAMNVPCVVSTNVKRDVDCGLGLLSFVSTEDTVAWVDAMEQAIKRRERKNNYEKMTECGYNIDNNVQVIETLYSGNENA